MHIGNFTLLHWVKKDMCFVIGNASIIGSNYIRKKGLLFDNVDRAKNSLVHLPPKRDMVISPGKTIAERSMHIDYSATVSKIILSTTVY